MLPSRQNAPNGSTLTRLFALLLAVFATYGTAVHPIGTALVGHLTVLLLLHTLELSTELSSKPLIHMELPCLPSLLITYVWQRLHTNHDRLVFG